MKNSIPVLNEDYICISKTNSALARRMLKKGEAEVVVVDPLVIKSSKQVETFLEEKGGFKMERVDLNKIFGKEQPIYLQNISNGVISLDLASESGEPIRDRLPNTLVPICITDKYSFDMLKKSHRIRTLLTLQNVGKKPLVKIMLQDEYEQWLENRSKKHGIAKEDLVTMAETKQTNVAVDNFIDNIVAPKITKTATHSEGDIITPKVLGVCQKLHPEVEPKMDPIEALDIFEMIDLTEDDLTYIINNCYNAIIKKWAISRQNELRGIEVAPIKKPTAEDVIRKAKRPKK